MRKTAIVLACVWCLPLSVTTASAQQKDMKGCTDHELFTRMPDSWIHHCSEKTFDAYAFPTGPTAKEPVEGRLWAITYYPQATATSKASSLQMLRNFENAVAKVGGKSVFATKPRETFTIIRDGKEIRVDLWTEFTGKADIKPESATAIGEVAKLLAAEPSLKVYVVGHTDNVGVLDANMKLSQERADAVVQALVRTARRAFLHDAVHAFAVSGPSGSCGRLAPGCPIGGVTCPRPGRHRPCSLSSWCCSSGHPSPSSHLRGGCR